MTVPLERQKNIADVAPRVREQLGLRGSAVLDVGTGSGTVAAGDDPRIVLAFKRVGGLVSDWNGTTGTDNRAALQAALDGTDGVIIPPGKYAYKGTLYVTRALQEVQAWGAEFYWLGRDDGNGEAFPMLIVNTSAVAGEWNGGKFDHRGDQWVSATSGPAQANVALESAVIIMADSYESKFSEVFNGFDNGVGLMAADLATGAQVVTRPRQAKVYGVHTYNCGVGRRTHDITIGPHQAGSGVNILTGSACIVENCTDDASRTNFIGDYAGGASGMFSNCVGRNAKLSAWGTITFDGESVRPGGFGVYSGSREMQFNNVQIYDPEGVGIWTDGFAANNQLNNTFVKGSRRQAYYIQGAGISMTSPFSELASYNNSGAYEAIKVVGTAVSGGVFGDSTNITIINPVTSGGFHSVGLRIKAGDAGRKVIGQSIGGFLNGVTSGIDNQQRLTFPVSLYKTASNGESVISEGLQEVRRANQSFVTAAFGDTQRNGTLFLSDTAIPAKRIAMGYDPVNDVGIIQVIHAGVAQKGLLINPSGGNVGVGNSSDYKLDVGGSFGFTPGDSVIPVSNGDVVFQLTSNTQLTVKAKGSDGVIRSGNITLA